MQTTNRILAASCICIAAVLVTSNLELLGAEKGQSGMKDKTAFGFPAGQRQLFLDDVGIAKITGLKRTMHPARKKGAVIRYSQSLSSPVTS